MPEIGELVSISDAVVTYKVTRQALDFAIKRGDLHFEMLAGRRLLFKAELDAYSFNGYSGKRPTKKNASNAPVMNRGTQTEEKNG